ncbi:MAG TPA: RnfABCDGE type electron transport complex subunit B [Burkholderiales bacterium]|nr:RnfABCDGE type electron transport complex subunit B [Burkholderiales bacterium]
MRRKEVALVDENRCIGCVRCIEACPVDAIVGAQGLMHTVVEPWCIGCALCPPACPVDCIDMVAPRGRWSEALKRAAARRAVSRKSRLKAGKAIPAKTAEERRRILADILSRSRK